MLEALRFRSSQPELLAGLSEEDWKRALNFCDRMKLTLALAQHCAERAPEYVRARLDRDLNKNAQRWDRMRATYRELASQFESARIECIVLKGFSHCPLFVSDPRYRWQGDLDLLFTENQVREGYAIAQRLGYEPLRTLDRFPTDHLPTMIRKTGWQWRGDYFDPEIPVSLELHFRLWDEQTEGFRAPGLEQFWERRQSRLVDDLRFLSLDAADSIASATLHLLRHLLRGSLSPGHVYELAWMLHHNAGNRELWNSWLELHEESLRALEAIAFALAERWFDCDLHDAARSQIEHLSEDVKRWLDLYDFSALEGRFYPNKDELWLHWSLLDSTGARWRMVRRRLLPEKLPPAVGTVHVPDAQRTLAIRLSDSWRYLAYASSRLAHHLGALPPTAMSAFRWFSGRTGLGPQYWRFFFAEGFFDFGMFVFVFLYNLYLLQIGYQEDFIGLVSSSMTAGSVVGSLLAAIAIQRLGLRKTLLASFALTATISALRAYSTARPALLGLAFASGSTMSVWAVAFSPAIAHLTNAKNRALGFSLTSSVGIAIGIAGSQAAGRLPGWLTRLHWAPSVVASYRQALLAGCLFVVLAIWAFRGVEMVAAPAPEARKFHRPSPLVTRFLIAMFVWSIGTGALNPFFNVFFTRRIHMPLEQIGMVVSIGQIAQVATILAAPLVFRRYGLTRSISGMQFATGLTLIALAGASGAPWAAAGYTAYMMTQYMSEPGLFTMLMESAPVSERGSASALNFLVSFAGQAIASAVAGAMLARFGYPPVFVAAALICAAAAFLFRVLLDARKPDQTSTA